MNRAEVPWAKRCVNLSNVMWDMAKPKVKEEILKGIARGDIWLAKIRRDQSRSSHLRQRLPRSFSPQSRGTCLLEHINLAAGRCRRNSLCICCMECKNLIDLHSKTGVESTGEYLTQEEDRQVGLGMLGLANSACAGRSYLYEQFGEALNQHLYESFDGTVTPAARKIVTALQEGINAAAQIAQHQ